jgi:Golgi nucleoside diphosphatase
MAHKPKVTLMINIMIIAISMTMTVTAATSSSVVVDGRYDLGIMMDAGSTGTRIFIYKWDHREVKHLPQFVTFMGLIFYGNALV